MKKTAYKSILILSAMILGLAGCAQTMNPSAQIITSEEQTTEVENINETSETLITTETFDISAESAAITDTTTIPSESAETEKTAAAAPVTTTAQQTTTTASQSSTTAPQMTTTQQTTTAASQSATAAPQTTTTQQTTTAESQSATTAHQTTTAQQTTTTAAPQTTTSAQQTTAAETPAFDQTNETATEAVSNTRGNRKNFAGFGSFEGIGSTTAISSDTTLSVYSGSSAIDTSDLFSNRDLKQTADTSEAQTITVASGKTINITDEGIYVINGSAENCTIIVNADESSKVQLVLDGVNITNDDFPAIYVVSADKCFVTTTDKTSTLSVTGQFRADGDTNTDAVIFSKDDLVLNGVGTLTITSAYGNGITGKDDLKITGGTYTITSAQDSIEANDSIRICGGSFTINSQKDALHCENDDDGSVGWIYISDGEFDITASGDGIQATTILQIDGGTISIRASEGIEASYVQINGGQITISASDDGINASRKSTAITTPTVEINGGEITITMGQGDTDGIDSNGNIYVNGGTVNVSGQSAFDYDGVGQLNGGTVIVNGQQVTSLPQSMMGGGFGGQGGFGVQDGFGGQGGFGGHGGFGTVM